jgi:hypothetical protein
VVSVVVLVIVSACGAPASDTEPGASSDAAAGLRALAESFLARGTDPRALYLSLRPAARDYPEVFQLDAVIDARRHYDGYWQNPLVVAPAAGQTEYTIESVTTRELLSGTGSADEFASGYRAIAPRLEPDVAIYQIVFHQPGQTFGMTLDGLVHVHGTWRIFPAPWALLNVNEPGHHHY